MKAFRFRFASVQKVRRIEMDLQARALAEAMQVLQKIELEIDSIRGEYRNEVARLKQEAQEKHFQEVYVASRVNFREELTRREQRALKARQDALLKIEEERKKLIERERRKKVFDKLEERDREIYHEESRKSEQAEMDEVASRCGSFGLGSESSDA